MIFSLSSFFSSLNMMCLAWDYFKGLAFILLGVLLASCICNWIAFINLEKFPTIISSTISSAPFSSVSGALIIHVWNHFLSYHSSWMLCSGLFSLSCLLFVLLLMCTDLSSSLLILFLAMSSALISLSKACFISIVVKFFLILPFETFSWFPFPSWNSPLYSWMLSIFFIWAFNMLMILS